MNSIGNSSFSTLFQHSGPKPLFNTHIGQRNTNEGLVHNHDDVANAAPGAGPRHLVLHPSLNIAYLACELQSRVQVKGRLPTITTTNNNITTTNNNNTTTTTTTNNIVETLLRCTAFARRRVG